MARMALTLTAELAPAGFGMAGRGREKTKLLRQGRDARGGGGEEGGTKICGLVGVPHSRITSPAPGKLAIYIGVGQKESFAPADGESWLGASGQHLLHVRVCVCLLVCVKSETRDDCDDRSSRRWLESMKQEDDDQGSPQDTLEFRDPGGGLDSYTHWKWWQTLDHVFTGPGPSQSGFVVSQSSLDAFTQRIQIGILNMVGGDRKLIK